MRHGVTSERSHGIQIAFIVSLPGSDTRTSVRDMSASCSLLLIVDQSATRTATPRLFTAATTSSVLTRRTGLRALRPFRVTTTWATSGRARSLMPCSSMARRRKRRTLTWKGGRNFGLHVTLLPSPHECPNAYPRWARPKTTVSMHKKPPCWLITVPTVHTGRAFTNSNTSAFSASSWRMTCMFRYSSSIPHKLSAWNIAHTSSPSTCPLLCAKYRPTRPYTPFRKTHPSHSPADPSTTRASSGVE
mmetsp:Transcript_40918/g.128842  ORF Transcript_40918/g.128842 Transcript_40918/m.128842 type:complete len:246 (-) Transcript_40918:663-1400(-)